MLAFITFLLILSAIFYSTALLPLKILRHVLRCLWEADIATVECYNKLYIAILVQYLYTSCCNPCSLPALWVAFAKTYTSIHSEDIPLFYCSISQIKIQVCYLNFNVYIVSFQNQPK